MGNPHRYITVCQKVFKITSVIFIIFIFGLNGCSEAKSNDPSGEWRLTAVQRQAAFGSRADRIEIPPDALIPIYFNLLENGSFLAESSRSSTTGQWIYQKVLQQIVLKSEKTVADTLRITGSGESMNLVLTKRTKDGVIEVTYSLD